jgi:DNA-binding NarL/FixJ family response regulator
MILCDISMPGRNGLEFIKDLKALHPNMPVLAISMHDETLYAERVLRAGGNGYIMKSNCNDEVLKAIRSVLRGQVCLSKSMSEILITKAGRGYSQREDTQFSQLSYREIEVFQLIGQGSSTHDIAERLHVSTKTVGAHRMHIKEKFAMKNSAEVVKHAVRWAATNQMI